MRYRVLKTRRFIRSLSKLDKPVADRILKDVRETPLEENPTSGKPLKDVVRVKIDGRVKEYRLWELKVGPRRSYRVFYIIEAARKEVYLLDVRHRRVSFR